MKNKIIVIFIIAVCLFSFFGVSYINIGNVVVNYPSFIIDTFVKAPDGSEWNLENFIKYIASNIILLTPVGLVADVTKIASYQGNIPRNSCTTELDRLVYFTTGSFSFISGNEFLISDFRYTYRLSWILSSNYDVNDYLHIKMVSKDFPAGALDNKSKQDFILTGFESDFYGSMVLGSLCPS